MAAFIVFLALSPMVTGSPDSIEDIGHSRDFHLIDDATAWERMLISWNQNHQQQTHRYRRDSMGPSLEEIEKFIRTYESAFQSAQKTLLKLVNHTAILTGRLKSALSIQEKLVRKNQTLNDLTDIIGLRLTCQTVNDSLRIQELIMKAKSDFNVTEIKCYGMCPGSSKYRPSGYRRIHLILFIKDGRKFAELQIGTPYTNMWSDWNHDFIYKGPEQIAKDKAVEQYSLAMADYFWKLDEERRMLPSCPKILKQADALKILRDGVAGDHAQETYKTLGYPQNACFWWNDMKLALPETKCAKTSSSSNDNNVRYTMFIIITVIFYLVM